MAYAPGFDPDFAQGLEPDRPWVLVKGDKRTCPLEYRDVETGARRVVPNVSYNQPAAWRASAMRFYETERLESAARMERADVRYERWMIEQALAGAERCRLMAEEFERAAASGAYPREA